MKKVLYTKYNSLRCPKYQLKTSIIVENDKKYVEKSPLVKQAQEGIQNIKDNYSMLGDLYENIDLLPFEDLGDRVRFAFVEGTKIDSHIDYANDSVEVIVEKVKEVLKKIQCYRQEYVVDFEMTDGFRKMFPGCVPDKGKAIKKANLDAIFDNFISLEDKILCLDYEWGVDFCVPKNYVQYRCLLYLYIEHSEHLLEKIMLKDFIRSFDFKDDEINLYSDMENLFQQHVHGTDRISIYTKRYEKTVQLFDEINRNAKLVQLKEDHINNLDHVIKEQARIIEQKQMDLGIQQNAIVELQDTIERLNTEIAEQRIGLSEQQKYIEEQQKCIAEQQKSIEMLKAYFTKVRYALRHPIYGAKVVSKRMVKKVLRRANVQETNNGRIEERIKSGILEDVRDSEPLEENINVPIDIDYEKWIQSVEAKETYDEEFAYNPKISVLVPVYNVLDKHLIPCIESVINQVYENWELCLADDCSTWENVHRTLKNYEDHPKIKIVYRKENGHISNCTNSALEIATGEYIAFLDCDDILRPNALYEVVKKLNQDRDLDFIYSDEDKVDDDGNNRHMPHFKPDWSPDTLMSHMYTCHLGVYRTKIAREIGGLRAGFEGAQDYDFTLRFTEKTNKIAHISKILYHWRERIESTATSPDAKPYILNAAERCKQEAVERRGLKAKIEMIDGAFQYRVNYISQKKPLISIVIPSKDNYEILKRCIDSLFEKTKYDHFEVLLIDNGSDLNNKKKYSELAEKYKFEYIYQKMDFNFSKMCNKGAIHANGEYLLFLNDDIEIIDEEWLERMLGQAELNHVGAVGAKLLYPDSHHIQHCGVINIEDGPSHVLANYTDAVIYNYGRNIETYNYSAVTAACLLVEKSKYYEVGGFEEKFAVAYNDIDFCFKLIEKGYFNVVRNDAVLYHHESISRGNDAVDEKKFERLKRERELLYSCHPDFVQRDPFYNEMLTQNGVDFSCNYSYGSGQEKFIETNIDIPGETDIICNIDQMNRGNICNIIGWAFRSACTEFQNIKVYLCDEEKGYVISANKCKRSDVKNAYGSDCPFEYVGFICDIPVGKMKSGIYKVGIMIDEQCIMTDKVYEV